MLPHILGLFRSTARMAIAMGSPRGYSQVRETLTGDLPPPPGVIPNFDHPQDILKTTNLVVQILCLFLSTPCVILRLYIRGRVVRSVGREDWCCLIAWVFATAYFISGIMMGAYGGGNHDWELRRPMFVKFKEETYFDIALSSPTLFFTKATILLVFVRVFSPMRNYIRAIYAFIGTMFLYYFASTITKIWICTPIEGFWRPEVRVSCVNTPLLFRVDNCVSVTTDLLICILPIPLMWSIQMTWRKKMGIGMLLGAGGLATACSATRLIITSIVDEPDATLGAMKFKILSSSEIAIALTCACVPSFHALFSRISDKSRAKSNEYTSSVKMSKWSNQGKGSRGIKSNAISTFAEDNVRRNSSLEQILKNPTHMDEEFGYRCQVSADEPESADAGSLKLPIEGMRVSRDHVTTHSTINKDMV